MKFFDYLKERFTKEKISSIGGLFLTVAGVAGYITAPQLAAIHGVATVFGVDLGDAATTTAIAGAVSVLLPTSKFKKKPQ